MTRTSHYAWMALGGVLCLLGVYVVARTRDGNKAMAQQAEAKPVVSDKPAPPPLLPPLITTEPPTAEVVPAGALVPSPAEGVPPVPVPEMKADPKTPPNGSDSRPIVIPASATMPPPPPSAVPSPAVSSPLPPIVDKADSNLPPPAVPTSVSPPPSVPTPGPVATQAPPPADAPAAHDAEPVRPLPPLRSRPAAKAKTALPLTGTFPLAVDGNKVLTLPPKILEQLGNCDTVLLSPGSDRCLWLTNQDHLDRLQAKLDQSPARESDVREFKRLYYAQTAKVPVTDGKLAISDKFAAFAGLAGEVVLVGIDDHFEVWDAVKWRKYMQTKKAASSDD